MTLRPRLAAGLALLAGLAVLYVILGRTVHAPPALASLTSEAPHPAPSVAFADASGRRHTLREFRGRFVLINLWGTWCAPCARELPALARLSQLLPPRRMAVIAVAVPPGDAESARAFLIAHDAKALAAYFDTRTEFLRAFRAYGLHITVLIDPRGNEIARIVGAAKWDDPDAVAYLKAEFGT